MIFNKDIKNIIIYAKKTLNKPGYVGEGFYRTIKEKTKHTHHKIIYVTNFNGINMQKYISNTLFILVNDNKNELCKIPFNFVNYYIITEYTDSSFFKYETNGYKNFLYVSEYNTKTNLNGYNNLEQYTYLNNRHLIIPWGSIFHPSEIVNNLNSYTKQGNKTLHLYIGNFNRFVNTLKNTQRKRIPQKIDKEIDSVSKVKSIVSIRNTDDTVDFMLLTRMSMGTFGTTNSNLTQSLMNNLLCYCDNDNTNEQNQNIIDDYYSSKKRVDMYEILELITTKHTFGNRLKLIFELLIE
jgi:hypothetical protein